MHFLSSFLHRKNKGTWSLLLAIPHFVLLLYKTKPRSHEELIRGEFDLKAHSSQ